MSEPRALRPGLRPWPDRGPVADEYAAFVDGLHRGIAPYLRTRVRFGRAIPRRTAGARLAKAITAAVDAGRPASFVRVGEGEGNLLALGLGSYPALTEYFAVNRSVKHFGTPDVLVQHADELLGDFDAALAGADVIGVHPWRFLRISLGLAPNADRASALFGVAASYEYLRRNAATLHLRRTAIADASFHRALLPHYASMVEGRDIAVVTCHRRLADALRTRFGATDVTLHPVPAQAKLLRRGAGDTEHLPDRYRQLLDDLRTTAPGRLHLVGAGLLAKAYCEAIRAAGGVAVDVGSVMDIWCGVRSRAHTTPDVIDRWRLV